MNNANNVNNAAAKAAASKKKMMLAAALIVFFCCVCCCISSVVSGGGLFFASNKKGGTANSDETDETDETDDVAPPPIKVSAGTSVQCVANELRGKEGSIYRSMEDGTLAHYPNPEIASSWNPNWSKGIMELDCAGFTKGEDLNKNIGLF